MHYCVRGWKQILRPRKRETRARGQSFSAGYTKNEGYGGIHEGKAP